MKKAIFLLALIISTNIFAAMGINNPQLSNLVEKAKSLYTTQKYPDAAKSMLTILNMTNETAKTDLSRIDSETGYPLAAIVQAYRMMALFGAGKCASQDFKNECLQSLKKYKQKPGKVVLTPYIQIYQQLLNHYFSLNQSREIENAFFEITDYDPRTLPYFYNFLQKILIKPVDPANDELSHPHYKETLEQIKQAVVKYEKTNPPLNPQIQYFKIKLLEASGEDVFKLSTDYLKKNPATENTKLIVETMRNALNPDKPEQIKQYYKMLTILAIKQPSDKEHIETVSFLLNEKKKLETILPELRNQ